VCVKSKVMCACVCVCVCVCEFASIHAEGGMHVLEIRILVLKSKVVCV
jgi:hypothetical protein